MMKPSLPLPPIPVVFQWTLPVLPRAGDTLRCSPPKRSANHEPFGAFDDKQHPINCIVRGVNFDDRPNSPHSAHGWVITLYLDPV